MGRERGKLPLQLCSAHAGGLVHTLLFSSLYLRQHFDGLGS
jgi:hypothetical protein